MATPNDRLFEAIQACDLAAAQAAIADGADPRVDLGVRDFECKRSGLCDVSFVGEGLSAIHYAAATNCIPIVELLLDKFDCVNTRTVHHSNTPLRIAVLYSTNDMVAFLLSRGADVNARNMDGYTALYGANTLDKVELLLSAGADVNYKRVETGNTKLHAACLDDDNDDALVSLLLAHGADVIIKNNDGLIPIDVCAKDSKCYLLLSGGSGTKGARQSQK